MSALPTQRTTATDQPASAAMGGALRVRESRQRAEGDVSGQCGLDGTRTCAGTPVQQRCGDAIVQGDAAPGRTQFRVVHPADLQGLARASTMIRLRTR